MGSSSSRQSPSKDFLQRFINLRDDIRKSLDLQFPDQQKADLPVRLLRWVFTDYNALILLGGFLCFLILLVIIVAIYIKEIQKNGKDTSAKVTSEANKNMGNTSKKSEEKRKPKEE